MKLPDRPKRWKQKAFEVMNEAVHTRQEITLVFVNSCFGGAINMLLMQRRQYDISAVIHCGYEISISRHAALSLIRRIYNRVICQRKSNARKDVCQFRFYRFWYDDLSVCRKLLHDRSRSMSFKSVQMVPCHLSCLWMWTTADNVPRSHHVPVNKAEGELHLLHDVNDDTLDWLATTALWVKVLVFIYYLV